MLGKVYFLWDCYYRDRIMGCQGKRLDKRFWQNKRILNRIKCRKDGVCNLWILLINYYKEDHNNG